jgi:glutamate--cysteine ligase catalytic subunit
MLVHIFVRLLYEDWFRLNFYIPMSLLEENFKRSRKKDAILNERFYFRTNLVDDGPPIV